MSYLAPLRIHFAGQFQAAPSTINNVFDNYRVAQTGPPTQRLWNARGSGDWRLVGCRVTSAFGTGGASAAADDPVRRLVVADSDRQAPAKLVDLDPQQQGASTIWGLEVRLAEPDGRTRLTGRFAPASFAGLWVRVNGANPGLSTFGAEYQSVLTDLQWDVVDDSEVLSALRTAADDSGALSIKFNVDGYVGNAASARFTRGRLVGTLGPAAAGEPRHLVLGRRLIARPSPTAQVNFCSAVVDDGRRTLTVDLGNALTTTSPGGPLADLGPLTLSCQPTGQSPTALGTVVYTAASWYPETAGVVSLDLGDAQLTALRNAPLVARLGQVVVAAEARDGRYVRADRLVHRLDPVEGPSDHVEIPVFASTFGRPKLGADIRAVNDPSGLGPPPVDTTLPADQFTAQLPPTDAGGRTVLTVTPRSPVERREAVDGQLFGLRLQFGGGDQPVADTGDLVSLLISNAYTPNPPLTWHGHIREILTPYAHLYPVMDDFLDLTDYEAVCAHRELLAYAFGLDVADPNSMPVTRDLSRGKRTAILRWLSALGPDGKPLLGNPPAGPEAAPEAAEPEPGPVRDAKAEAAARRFAAPGDRAAGGPS
jgi:hypothetical protein